MCTGTRNLELRGKFNAAPGAPAGGRLRGPSQAQCEYIITIITVLGAPACSGLATGSEKAPSLLCQVHVVVALAMQHK